MQNSTLHISAAGNNLRIRRYMIEHYNDMPKHFLPIPNSNHTLISHIVEQGLEHFGDVLIHVGAHTFDWFFYSFLENPRVNIVVDNDLTGSMGPAARALEFSDRVFACAGDFYCPFSWSEFVKFHESHDAPASILVSKSCPVPRGATFRLDGYDVVEWERPKMTNERQLLNISCYIFDHDPAILEIGREYELHKEDTFFTELSKGRKLAAYVCEEKGFNVNHKETYLSMKKFVSERGVVGSSSFVDL